MTAKKWERLLHADETACLVPAWDRSEIRKILADLAACERERDENKSMLEDERAARMEAECERDKHGIEGVEWKCRAEKAEAERDEWKVSSEMYRKLVNDVASALDLADTDDRSCLGERVANVVAEHNRYRAVHEAELGVCQQYCDVVADLNRKARMLREAVERLNSVAKAIIPQVDNAASNEGQVQHVMDLGDATRIADAALRETEDPEETP